MLPLNVKQFKPYVIQQVFRHLTATLNFSGWRISLREDPQCCWNQDSCKKLKTKIQDVAT